MTPYEIGYISKKKKSKIIQFSQMVKKNTCVFISGKGSNLINLIKRSRDYNFPIKIRLVICNNKDAFGINYAKKISLPLLIINTKSRNYENQILNEIREI